MKKDQLKNKSPFFLRCIAVIKAIPKGKVLTYGKVSQLMGAPGCARQVSYVLSSSSKKYKLPWHRVIGASGKISPHNGSFRQKGMLEKEGVVFESDAVDLENCLWVPSKAELNSVLKGLPKHVSIYELKKGGY